MYAPAPRARTLHPLPALNPPLQVTTQGSDALVSWQASPAPDVAGYRIHYSEPDRRTTFVADVPADGDTGYTQQGLYLDGAWEFAVSAYDINGNESPRSVAVEARIGEAGDQVYLPLVRR